MLAGLADGPDMLCLVRLQTGHFEKAGHAKNAVQWRAEFVRDGGEEGLADTARGQRLRPLAAQGLLPCPALRDVAADGEDAAVRQQGLVPLRPAAAAAGGCLPLVTAALPSFRHARGAKIAAAPVVRRPAEQLAERAIDPDHGAGALADHDRFSQRGENV